MIRNFDLNALRSFLAVAETGGVTRAAAAVNLTQSAVSMQIRRLEDFVGAALLDRAGRGVALTPAGEQLAAYARRMLALNDEAWGRLTAPDYSGEIVLGVPQDIVHQAVPQVMRAFAAAWPRVRVDLISSFTMRLRESFARGEADIILTTEPRVEEGGEVLAVRPLIWVGAPGGQAWKRRPLRLAFEDACLFRRHAIQRLDEAGVAWERAVGGASSRAVEVAVAADLAVHAILEGDEKRLFFEKISHGGALPALGDVNINMYVSPRAGNPARDAMAGMIRHAYRQMPGPAGTGAGTGSGMGPLSHRDDDLPGGPPFPQEVEA